MKGDRVPLNEVVGRMSGRGPRAHGDDLLEFKRIDEAAEWLRDLRPAKQSESKLQEKPRGQSTLQAIQRGLSNAAQLATQAASAADGNEYRAAEAMIKAAGYIEVAMANLAKMVGVNSAPLQNAMSRTAKVRDEFRKNVRHKQVLKQRAARIAKEESVTESVRPGEGQKMVFSDRELDNLWKSVRPLGANGEYLLERLFDEIDLLFAEQQDFGEMLKWLKDLANSPPRDEDEVVRKLKRAAQGARIHAGI